MNATFADSVRQASTRAEVRKAIHGLYESLQRQIDLRKPICKTSGRCCRFDEFGHRLYVTTAEMATFIYERTPSPKIPSNPLAVLTSCPYQIDGLCSVHTVRPFGCRIFFCDASATDWQRQQYEIFHRRIQEVHRQLEIPYFYLEWREALAAVGL